MIKYIVITSFKIASGQYFAHIGFIDTDKCHGLMGGQPCKLATLISDPYLLDLKNFVQLATEDFYLVLKDEDFRAFDTVEEALAFAKSIKRAEILK